MLGLGLGLNKSTGGLNRPLLSQIPNAVGAWGLNRLNSDVVEYSNLVSNGDFSGGIVDIETSACTISYSDGLLKVDATGQFARIAKPINFVAGTKYFCKFFDFSFANINNVNSFTITTGNGTTFVETMKSVSLEELDTYVVFTPTINATHIRTNPSFLDFSLDVDYSLSSILVIPMTGTRYEDYTAEQMNEAFPFTPSTGKAIVPQKPIRVYRDSDNAETDIGLIGNKLDTASLLAFAGAGSAYVVKIYDQSNNGNNAIQSVAANCPRIVNNGVLEVDSNGDVSVYYEGVDDRFDVTDNSGLDITSGGLSLVAKYDPINVGSYMISRNLDSFATLQYALQPSANQTTTFILNGGGKSTDPTELADEKIITATYDDVNTKIYLDGTLKDTDNYSTALTSRANIQIACRSNSVDGTTKTGFYSGHISTIIIFNRAITQAEVNKLNRL